VGRDAKTGETLVKSALAPMFAGRNLRVMSWEGHNILGNTDGLVPEDEENAAGKLASKGDVLDSILPDIGHNRVRIDYTPSLADWKTAWDYIHFEGFLETEMKNAVHLGGVGLRAGRAARARSGTADLSRRRPR